MRDQLGREVDISWVPQRIISLVPSQTELLVDLGLEDSIVGITKFCIHPKRLRKERVLVGGTKTVKADKIKSLAPDIILCNKEENTEEMVMELQEIAPVHVSDIKTLPDALHMIGQYGEIFDVREKADKIIADIKFQEKDFREHIKNRPSFKVAYLIWKNPWMAVGKDTFINHMLQLNNFENIYSGSGTRYPNTTLTELEKADLVLLSTEPYPFKEKHRDSLRNHFPEKRIEIVDGALFSWYGSRLRKSFTYFRSLEF